jgi:hypothetical protein
MTWNIKVFRVVFALGVVGALALASGANFIDFWAWFGW